MDGTGSITGLHCVQVAQDMPVVRSPMQKTVTLKAKEARPRHLAFKDDWLATVTVSKKWKITDNVAQKILKDKSCPVPSVDAVYMQSYSRTRSARRMKRLVWS